jgi:hypothetical protein
MCEDRMYLRKIIVHAFNKLVSFLEMHMKKMMQQCCACGEAKYQLTFKGLWSAQTHKKDWPANNGTSREFFSLKRQKN